MFTQTKRKRTNTFSNETTAKRKRNQNPGMIVENKPLPVRILSCQEGNPTQYGTGTLHYSFQHLVSKEEFNSTVFENSAPAYIDNQIVDAVLPPEMEEFELEDLVNKGLFVLVKFRTRGDNTFINVMKAGSLNEKYRDLLAKLLTEEEQEQQAREDAFKDIENEMNDMDDDSVLDEDLTDLDVGEEDVNDDLDIDDLEFDDGNELDLK
jgi:hypothetical protein